LTGRENIFLNGAILGMTKAEIRSKFDEIVDFSVLNATSIPQ
jgi:lipopolysaccharide transport system ATP-binding protein